jgi:hypothetical protein
VNDPVVQVRGRGTERWPLREGIVGGVSQIEERELSGIDVACPIGGCLQVLPTRSRAPLTMDNPDPVGPESIRYMILCSSPLSGSPPSRDVPRSVTSAVSYCDGVRIIGSARRYTAVDANMSRSAGGPLRGLAA